MSEHGVEGERSWSGMRRLAIGLAWIGCLAIVLSCFVLARKGLHEAATLHQRPAARLVQDDFVSYHTHEYLSFLTKEMVDATEVKESIKRVGDRFQPVTGSVRTEPFQAPEYMVVPMMGGDPESVHTLELPEVFLRCRADDRRMTLLRAPSEGWFLASAHVPPGWCAGTSEIVGTTHQDRVHVGIGAPFGVSRLFWLLLQPWGTVAAAVLALTLVALITAPMMAAGGFAIGIRLFAVAAYPSVLGYLCYGAFWIITDHTIRMLVASALVGAPAAVLLIDARLRGAPVDWRAARLFLLGLGCVAVLCTVPYLLVPLGNGFWFPAYAYFPASWSTDNLLSVMMARNLVLLGPGHPEFLGTWSISDRGIIQAGTFCAAFLLPRLGSIFLSSPFNSTISNLYGCLIQGLPLPLALVFFAALGWSRGRIVAASLVVAASPFFIFNAFYIWPKLYGGMFVAIAILALWSALRRGSALALCAAIVAVVFAGMNHSSNLLAAPAVALYLLVALAIRHHDVGEILRLARRAALPALVVAGLMVVGLRSQEWFEPKSSWPILFLITGAGQFGLSPTEVHDRILDFVRHVDLPQLLHDRVARLATLIWIGEGFYTRSQIWPSLKFTRAVEEFSLLPSLGPGLVMLMLAGILSMGRRRSARGHTVPRPALASDAQLRSTGSDADRDLSTTMTLLWLCCLANLVLLAVAQGAQPVVHQLPYGLIEGVILGLVASRHRWTALVPVAAAVQCANAALVWFVGAWGFWHERL